MFSLSYVKRPSFVVYEGGMELYEEILEPKDVTAQAVPRRLDCACGTIGITSKELNQQLSDQMTRGQIAKRRFFCPKEPHEIATVLIYSIDYSKIVTFSYFQASRLRLMHFDCSRLYMLKARDWMDRVLEVTMLYSNRTLFPSGVSKKMAELNAILSQLHWLEIGLREHCVNRLPELF